MNDRFLRQTNRLITVPCTVRMQTLMWSANVNMWPLNANKNTFLQGWIMYMYLDMLYRRHKFWKVHTCNFCRFLWCSQTRSVLHLLLSMKPTSTYASSSGLNMQLFRFISDCRRSYLFSRIDILSHKGASVICKIKKVTKWVIKSQS